MKPATAKLMADAAIKTMDDVGLSVDEVLSHLMMAPVDDQSKELLRHVLTNSYTHDVEQTPEPTAEELGETLAALDRLKTLPQFLRQKLEDIRQGLPRTPNGPKRLIAVKDETRVCADVEALVREGYDRPRAVLSVANRRNASARTIYRILAKHGRTKPRKPRKTAVK
jgi:hypothetical protein